MTVLLYLAGYDSLRREVFDNNIIEVDITMEQVYIIEMCLNKSCSKYCTYKYLCDMFPSLCGLKGGNALRPWLFKFDFNKPLGKSEKTRQERN
jgi:hypothetical protein